MVMSADIDIDLADRTQLLKLIDVIPARMHLQDGVVRRHASGVYPTDIPWDPVNQCAAIHFQTAEQLGYFKIDLLNMSVYTLIKDQQQYEQMLALEPPWERLWTDYEFSTKLVHVGGSKRNFELLQNMRPDSVPRMAAFISIIRPGKNHLQNKPWEEVFASVWDGDASRGFVFKQSHAISYAALVALHMNLLNQADVPE
jgi:hypothetical protein